MGDRDPATKSWVTQLVSGTTYSAIMSMNRMVKVAFVLFLIAAIPIYLWYGLCFFFGICGDACSNCSGGGAVGDFCTAEQCDINSEEISVLNQTFYDCQILDNNGTCNTAVIACSAQQCDWNAGNISLLNESVTILNGDVADVNQTFYTCGLLDANGTCSNPTASCSAEQCEWNSGNITLLEETTNYLNQTFYTCGILNAEGMCSNMSAVWDGITNETYGQCDPGRAVTVFSVSPAAAATSTENFALSFANLGQGWINRANDPSNPGPCRGVCAFEMVCEQEFPTRVAYGNYSFLLTARNSSVAANSVSGGILVASHSDVQYGSQSVIVNGEYNRIRNSTNSLTAASDNSLIRCSVNSGTCEHNILIAGSGSDMESDVRGNVGVGYNHYFANCSQNYLFGHNLECIPNTGDISNSSAALPVLIVGDNNDVTSTAVTAGAMLVVAHKIGSTNENLMVMSADRNLYLSVGGSVIIGGAFLASAQWTRAEDQLGGFIEPGAPVQRLRNGRVIKCIDPQLCNGMAVHPKWVAQQLNAAEGHWSLKYLWNSKSQDWTINAKWDSNRPYIKRSERPSEWVLVATSGSTLVRTEYVKMINKHPRWLVRDQEPVEITMSEFVDEYMWLDL